MILLIDTSVFLNILNVPNRNQDYDRIMESFKNYVELNCDFVLPLATVIETGNHIAQNGDGEQRRRFAMKFCQQVEMALNGEAPYRISPFEKPQEMLLWLNEFPDLAGKNKSPDKKEGTSFGDLSIIKEFDKMCQRHSTQEVMIWSLDGDLSQKHYVPSGSLRI